MAMSGLLGNDRDVSRLKLLLSDRAQQGSFCLTFDFRVAGEDVGTLRVLLDADGYAVWEQGYSRAQGWQTELLTVAWKEEAPESVGSHTQHTQRHAGTHTHSHTQAHTLTHADTKVRTHADRGKRTHAGTHAEGRQAHRHAHTQTQR